MAAEDYHICPALFHAYIAKLSKRNPNRMLEDRRIIPENEIIGLITWWVEEQCLKNHGLDVVITVNGKTNLTLTPSGKLLEDIKSSLRSELSKSQKEDKKDK